MTMVDNTFTRTSSQDRSAAREGCDGSKTADPEIERADAGKDALSSPEAANLTRGDVHGTIEPRACFPSRAAW